MKNNQTFIRNKLFILFLFFCQSFAQQNSSETDQSNKNKSVEWIGSCETKEIEKAETLGLASLSFFEKIKYYVDTKKCKYKDESKRIHKRIDKDQLKEDAQKSKQFTGKASSCAYCAMTILMYFLLNS